jgi:hypothetical protein
MAMEQLIQWIVAKKALLGIASLLMGIAIFLAAILHANQQTAVATSKLAAERARAAQIDEDDKTPIEKIRERNRQKGRRPFAKVNSKPSAGET